MRTSVGMSVKEKKIARKRGSVSYHERKARIASRYSELGHIERKHRWRAKSARKDLEEMKRDNYKRDRSFEPLTEEEKEKLKKEREKRWKRKKRSTMCKGIEDIDNQLKNELPDSTEDLNGFPDEPITEERDGAYHIAEKYLRKEVERLIIEYRKSDHRRKRWKNEFDKESIRQSFIHNKHDRFQTCPYHKEDDRRLKENPKRVGEIVRDYSQAIEDNVPFALEKEFRKFVFENFDFTTIKGVGSVTAESLREIADKIDGTSWGYGDRKAPRREKTMDPEMRYLVKYLKLETGGSRDTYQYDFVENVGPKTVRLLEDVLVVIDEATQEYVEKQMSL